MNVFAQNANITLQIRFFQTFVLQTNASFHSRWLADKLIMSELLNWMISSGTEHPNEHPALTAAIADDVIQKKL